jgi:hypothetical protein
MTDALEELLEQFSQEEREPDLLDWLETLPLSASGKRGQTKQAEDGEKRQDSDGENGDGGVFSAAAAQSWAGPGGQTGTESEIEPEPQAQTGDGTDAAEAEETPLRRRQTGESGTGRRVLSGQENQAAEEKRRGREEQTGSAPELRVGTGETGGESRSASQQSALELYRQVVRAGYAASETRGQAGRTVITEQVSPGAPSLTADQLDRAVRRDSRRYDGGMELY